jgi:hypothetical protein
VQLTIAVAFMQHDARVEVARFFPVRFSYPAQPNGILEVDIEHAGFHPGQSFSSSSVALSFSSNSVSGLNYGVAPDYSKQPEQAFYQKYAAWISGASAGQVGCPDLRYCIYIIPV